VKVTTFRIVTLLKHVIRTVIYEMNVSSLVFVFYLAEGNLYSERITNVALVQRTSVHVHRTITSLFRSVVAVILDNGQTLIVFTKPHPSIECMLRPMKRRKCDRNTYFDPA
jgi:hypothetical protein